MKKICTLFIILSSLIFSQSQDPFNDYKEIKGKNVKIIYSKEMKNEANTILSYIEYQNKNNRKSVEGNLLYLPLILHKDTTISNGNVSYAPFKSEFYSTPPISNYTLGISPWLITLSIHEYRHALQSMQGREGINQVLYILFGEEIVSGLNHLAVPTWYWEGDAVVQETALSNSGRGRSNYFLKGYRSILLEGKPFSYEKAKNGSYKDYVPNYYPLGYMISSYGRYKYGYDFWKDIFSNATQYKGLLPFSSAIKNKTGLSSPEFYKTALNWWQQKWQSELKDFETYKSLVNTDGGYIKYGRSYKIGDSILTSKVSYDENSKFILLDKDKNEKKILTKNISNNSNYRFKDNYIIWDSFQSDKFWINKNYSNIYLYNLKNKKLKRITNKGKFFNPSINNNKDKIAASTIDYSNSRIGLAILDLNGTITDFISNNGNLYLEPLWTDDDNSIITTSKDTTGNVGLVKINLKNKSEEVIIPYGNYVINDIFLDNNKIYFSATFDYIDNIYAVNINTKEIKKLTNSKYGAYCPSIVDKNLIFIEYQKNGYFIKRTSIDNNYVYTLKSLTELSQYNFDFFQNEGGNIINKVNIKNYNERNYKPYKNLIHFNSWLFSADDDNLVLQAVSTNETNDLNIQLTYIYHYYDENDIDDENKEDEENFSIKTSYTRYWPYISFEYTNEEIDKNYTNKEMELKLDFPLNLTEGFYYRFIEPSISYLYDTDISNKVNSYKLALKFNNFIPKAYRNLNTKFGQSFNLIYINSMSTDNFNKLYFDSSLYTRGIGINDSFKLSFAYEKERYNAYDFNYSSMIDMPRGYDSVSKDNIYKLSFDYSFPLFYPDWGNNGLYFKRITSTLFYDDSAYSLDKKTHSLDSVGAEIYFDSSIFSLIDLTFGIRYSYQIETKDNTIEFVVPLQKIY